EAELPSNESGIGAMIAIFGRTNINRHYLQFEVGTSFYRNKTIFDIDKFNAATTIQTSINASAFTLDIPLLYGYNFVKKAPYELSLFAGPKMRYTYKYNDTPDNFGTYIFDINEPIHPITGSFIIGMATKISRFILDFRYEFAITVQSKPGTYYLYEGESLLSQGSIYMKRATNLLSFSLGVIL
ncbi:MAG: outer membrane beta-barrel protein, partial [Bacteroidales bacterium]